MRFNFTPRHLAASLMCGVAMTAAAAPLTPQQAMQRVLSSETMQKAPSARDLMLVHTEKNSSYTNLLYVFNSGTKGFVIASADDVLPAVLGYSDNGAFRFSEASPELKWWLSQYADQVSGYLNSGIVPVKSAPQAREPRPAVPELMHTRWNQAEPYNLDCPVENSYNCVTGCVATAMAQVVKYHGYPATGNGSHSYDWKGQTLSYDYAAANFDYANMLDEYDYHAQTATEAQNKAVADLMYACGVGVNMIYGYGESSAYSFMISNALTEYFGYDKGVRFLKRDCYTAEEWDDIIYAEMAAGRPVIYGGQSGQGGHEFVCDGYQGGYYHINWGWGGMGNGWFLLSALDPGQQGIGGFEGGYNYEQDAICGIQPNTGAPATTYPLVATGGLVAAQVYYNCLLYLEISNGLILNFSPVEISTSLYLKAVSQTGEETVGDATNLTFSAAKGGTLYGFSGLSMSIPATGQGDYNVYLMYTGPDGSAQPVPVNKSGADHLAMHVDADGTVSFSEVTPEQRGIIKVTKWEPQTEVISGAETTFNISIENISEYAYSGVVYVRAYRPGSEEAVSEFGISLDVNPGDVLSGSVGVVYNLPDGEYVQRCYDMYGEPCSEEFPLTVGHPVVLATSISLDQTTIDATVGTTVRLTATVLPDNTTDKTVAWSSSDTSVATVDQAGSVTIVANGTAVITASTTDGSDLHAQCTVYGKTSIEDIIGESGTADIYTPAGLLIRKGADAAAIDALPAGIYIIRTATGARKILK